jgi:integrase/recombinase XerD
VAKRLPSRSGLRPQTFATLFGLYVATGMCCNEPLRLDRSDVDLANGVLTIRGTKFGKSRYVPVTHRRSRPCRPMQGAATDGARVRSAQASFFPNVGRV